MPTHKKIVLVKPNHDTYNITPPLGLGYLASYLKKHGIEAKIIDALKKKNNPDNKKAHEWLEKNIAINIPRKFAVAAYEGLSGINIGNMEDWFIPFGAGAAPYMGLVDTASMLDAVRVPKEKRPGFYAVEMSVKYLDGFDAVRKIEAGSNVYAYEFVNNGKKVIVAWYDDGKLYSLDEELPSKEVSLPWEKSSAKIIEVPAKRGMQEGSMKIINAKNNKLDFTLGYTTVFIAEV